MNDPIVPPYEVPEEAAANSVVTSEAQKPPKMDPRFVIEHIGKIPYTRDGQHYTGCKMIQFIAGDDTGPYVSAVHRMNQYFEHHLGLLVVDLFISADAEVITVIATRTLTDEQLEIVSMRAHIIETMVQEEMEKKAKALEEAEARVTNDEKRLREMADVGEKCLKNHGAVVKQMREKKRK